MRRILSCLGLLFAFGAVLSCSGKSDAPDDREGCTPGKERCACDEGECDPGLQCLSELCVTAGSSGGAGGSGGGANCGTGQSECASMCVVTSEDDQHCG